MEFIIFANLFDFTSAPASLRNNLTLLPEQGPTRAGSCHRKTPDRFLHYDQSEPALDVVPCMLTDLPNMLTLSRIAAIPVLVVLASMRLPGADLAACVVFTAAAITDYFDGHFARSRRQQSDLGRMLDPIADKLLVGAAVVMLAGEGGLRGWTLYAGVVILLREILVSGLREYLAGIRKGLPVTKLAKWKTGFQMGALGTLLAGDSSAELLHLGFLPVSAIGAAMLWVAAVLTLLTGWDYLNAGLRHATSVQPSTRAMPPP